MKKPKKGDVFISNKEAWELLELQSGICLVKLLSYKGDPGLKPGTRATFSLSQIKHKIVSGHFRHVSKEKSRTIKVLYS